MAMVYDVKVKWEPAKPLKRPDFIQSSEYGRRKHFHPSYEQEPVDMFYLLGMEYQRMWARERTAWEEQHYPIPTERKKIKIRSLKIAPKKKAYFPPFKIKKFQNIAARTDHKRIPKAADKEMKVKPCTCDTNIQEQNDQKLHTPKYTRTEEKECLHQDSEKGKQHVSSDCHSDKHKLDDQSSVCTSQTSQKSAREKEGSLQTDVEGEEVKHSVCCCDMGNLDAQSTHSK